MEANKFYPLGQIAKALQSPDDKRQTAQENQNRRDAKVTKWNDAFDEMLQNRVKWGSRQPIQGVPVWATPEILKGGFASGGLLASLDPIKDMHNEVFLTQQGAQRLIQALETGCYRVQYPEQGALLAVAWFLKQDRVEAAEAILAEISPYFDRLRFYPEFAESPLGMSVDVSVQSVSQCIKNIEEIVRWETNRSIPRVRKRLEDRNAVLHWLPLKYDLLALFHETMDDSGWPCQSYQDGWMDRASRLLQRYEATIERDDKESQEFNEKHGSRTPPLNMCRRIRGSTVMFVDYIKKIVAMGPEALSGRDVGRIRKTLLDVASKYGAPGSEKFEDHITEVKKSCPPLTDISKIEDLLRRLKRFAQKPGLSSSDIDSLLLVDDLPETVKRAVQRARLGTIDELVAFGNINSSEMLAALVPAIFAHAETSSVCTADPELGRLCYAMRISFSARRSVLLFNLESQVRLSELPWCKELWAEQDRLLGSDRATIALATLQQVAATALEEFPQTMFPNKLLQSFRGLSPYIEDAPVWTDELARDIFMGRFSAKFATSARVAAHFLAGTPYEAYYDLNGVYFLANIMLNEGYDAERLVQDCLARAGMKRERGRWGYTCTQSGKIIEQQMIISSQNLAACYKALGLRDKLDNRALALKAWRWIVQDMAKEGQHWKMRILRANAWRQLMFFVSMMDDEADRLALLPEMQYEAAVSLRKTRYLALHDELKEYFFDPLGKVLNGQAPEKQFLGLSSEKV